MTDQAGVVVILGAGASHAINSAMPLTDELGEHAARHVGTFDIRHHQSLPGWFEAVLSRLAENQPDLDEAQNLRNQGLFRELAAAATSIVNDREALTLDSPIPGWLAELCAVWHERQTTVITFNYDTLVERATAAAGLYDWGTRQHVTADDAIGRLPAWAPGPGRLGAGAMPASIRLKKLHGSVAWYSVPGDFTGATLARRSVGGWEPEPLDPAEIRQSFPGREPFIVPPASAKSGFYRNPVLRQLWQDAGEALSGAGEVHLVGYSLPAADLVTRGMLLDRTSRTARWSVTDAQPDRVSDQLASLGFAASTEFRSIEEYATDEVARLAADTTKTLSALIREQPPDTPIIVSWGENPAYAIGPRRDSAGRFSTSGSPVAIGQIMNGLDHVSHLTAGAMHGAMVDSSRLPHIEITIDGTSTKVVGVTELNEYNSPAPRPAIALRCAIPPPA